MKTKEEISWIEIAYFLSPKMNSILEVPLKEYYGNLGQGHYRYTKNIDPKETITVEFDVK